jgi:hypothetical protein
MSDKEKTIYMRKGDEYDSIVVDISQEKFATEIQLPQKATTDDVTLSLQIVQKDGKGRVITALTQSVDLVVKSDPPATNPCADVTLKPGMQRTTDFHVAFEADPTTDQKVKKFMIPETLGVEWDVKPAAGVECPVVYRLLVFDTQEGNTGAFVPADDLWARLRTASSTGYLRSEFIFEPTTGSLDVMLESQDVEEHRARFTENGVSTIRCKVVANAPGSTQSGAGASDDTLLGVEFNFVLAPQTEAARCA